MLSLVTGRDEVYSCAPFGPTVNTLSGVHPGKDADLPLASLVVDVPCPVGLVHALGGMGDLRGQAGAVHLHVLLPWQCVSSNNVGMKMFRYIGPQESEL